MIKTVILDRGHATLDIQGKYMTPGKQALLKDGRHVYEGKENQKYAECLAKKFEELEYKILFTVDPDDPYDLPLDRRVRVANASPDRHNSLYISLHNNAGGNETATGTEIFTSIGQTLSDIYAEEVMKAMKEVFIHRKFRTDRKDGDDDKEENFYVIRKTCMPAMLIEFGFFDNPTDYDWLSNPSNIERACECIVNAVINADVKLYGKEAWASRNN